MVSDWENERLAAVRATGLVDAPPQLRFDRVVRLARRVFDVPIAAVNLVEADRQFTLAGAGVGRGNLPRGLSLCSYTVESAKPLVIPDAAQDERFHDHPLVTGATQFRFYAGVPLTARGGYPVGTLCLIDTQPHAASDIDLGLLQDLADWVEKEIEADADLTQAREVQRRLMPRRTLDVPGLEVAGRCLPSRDVGGDFYNWQLLDGCLQVVVGDVMGKGMAAALIAAGVRAVLRGTSRFNPLDESVTRTGLSTQEDLDEVGSFVTLFTARLDPVTGDMEYVDAGHGLAMIVDQEGRARRVQSAQLPLGAIPGNRWTAQQEHLGEQERLMVISDGVLDAFEDLDSVVDAGCRLGRHKGDAASLVEQITDYAASRGGSDDVTALVVQRTGS